MSDIEELREVHIMHLNCLMADVGLARDLRKRYEKQENELKNKLFQDMKKLGLVYFANEYIEARILETSMIERVDAKKLKEENPNIYNNYVIISEKKEHLRINDTNEKGD